MGCRPFDPSKGVSALNLVDLRVDDHVATVVMQRSEAMNALSGEMADTLSGAILQAAAEPKVWVMILASAGDRAFCVGADLKERTTLDDAGWLRNRILMRGLFESLRSVPQPTIASVFGHALGGGFELALSCDLMVASDDAVFGLPETTLGIVPGGGGTQLLARRIGITRAKELIFTGRRLTAQEAQRMGLVSKVVTKSELRSATTSLAREICKASPIAVQEAKRAVDNAFDLPLEHGIELEDLAWRRAVASEDRKEGIAAFNQKRDPEWKGR